MAMLTGNEVFTGAKDITKIEEGIVDSTGGTYTLKAKMESITSVYLLDSDGMTNLTLLSASDSAPDAEEYSVATAENVTTLTFHADQKGKKIRVYYTTKTGPDAKTIKVTSDKFGGTYGMVVDVLIRDENTGQDFYGQFIAPRVKIEDDFSFNFSPDGDPSVLDIPVEVLKDPASTTMWELVIYG